MIVFLLVPLDYLAGLRMGKYLAARRFRMSGETVERNLL
jgi:hypothetical protein